jgi:hypothetical protein
MSTREYADLVSAVAETLDQVLTADAMMPSDPDQLSDAEYTVSGPVHAYVLDFEKIVWHYPDAPARLIEE